MPNLYTMSMKTQQFNNLQAQIACKPTPLPQEPHFEVLSPEIMSRQATINIGIIGQAALDQFPLIQNNEEEERNSITSFPGYSTAKIFKCPRCLRPDCYKLYPSTTEDDPHCPNLDCDATLRLVRHVSFVHYQNQETLIAKMLAGDAIIDAALLLTASNSAQAQQLTSEHLAALEMMNLGDRTLILQSKSDQDDQHAMKKFQEIKAAVKGTKAQNAPIIPISSEMNYNIDAVAQNFSEHIPVPVRDFSSAPEMLIMRSFDVNKPGMSFDEMKGGVVTGRILRGVLKIGDKVEIRPGHIVKDDNNRISHYVPIVTKVVSLSAGNNSLEYAVPGGLISVELAIDPSLAESSKLAGNILGLADQMPEVYKEIELSYYLLTKLLGGKTKTARVEKITEGERLKINIGSCSIEGSVKSVDDQRIKISLISKPVSAKVGEKITISRRIRQTWRLIGWGSLEDGEALAIMKP